VRRGRGTPAIIALEKKLKSCVENTKIEAWHIKNARVFMI
jgi:hypothetical protein